MRVTIRPARSVAGGISLPGDKSISHRYAIISSLAEGASVLHNYATGADCHSTLHAIRALGIEVTEKGADVTVHGRGLRGWQAPTSDLDAGNSGSAMRMLAGPLAAQPFTSRIIGDESLSRRPMDRIIQPLMQMGAELEARDGRFPPLVIHGGTLHPIEYTLPVASAQVKTCVLFAGLFAEGETVVHEPVKSRDHTEIALREFGAEIAGGRRDTKLSGPATLKGRDLLIPSDISSAAFFMVAGLMLPDSDLVIQGVGLNPTRSTLLDTLIQMGGKVRVIQVEEVNGELIGDIGVQGSAMEGGVIEGGVAAALIDEIPVLAVLGSASKNGLVVKDAKELRVKETDRIATVAENFRRMGIAIQETPDGMIVPGQQKFRPAEFDSFGDHRIAMAFAIAALHADGECIIDNADAASVSFPEFYNIVEEVAKR